MGQASSGLELRGINPTLTPRGVPFPFLLSPACRSGRSSLVGTLGAAEPWEGLWKPGINGLSQCLCSHLPGKREYRKEVLSILAFAPCHSGGHVGLTPQVQDVR